MVAEVQCVRAASLALFWPLLATTAADSASYQQRQMADAKAMWEFCASQTTMPHCCDMLHSERVTD